MIKVYKSGLDFISENEHILKANPLEECFVRLNAASLNEFSLTNYAIKIYDDNHELIALKNHPNLLIIGDDSLVDELVYHIVTLGLKFEYLLVNENIANKFIKAYNKYFDCSFNVLNSMSIMSCDCSNQVNYKNITQATLNDVEEIYELAKKFKIDANVQIDINEQYKQKIINAIDSYYYIKENNKIVSIASIDRNTDYLMFISFVFTLKEFRNKGYAYKIVSYLTNKIIENNKIAALYVDNTNPVSNHLYSKIGYKYNLKTIHYHVKENNIKSCILAGGCFWCMAKPYYEYEGIKNVFSGYCGGSELFPSYEAVKSQQTSHRETVKILYDSSIIKYNDILKIYLSSIDPFDVGGQYIDRGFSYTTAIFYQDDNQKEIASSFLGEIEMYFNKKPSVKLLKEKIFYMAEEYHQDYALKNPVEMEKELINSGRKKYE